jgi:hypothetical protein
MLSVARYSNGRDGYFAKHLVVAVRAGQRHAWPFLSTFHQQREWRRAQVHIVGTLGQQASICRVEAQRIHSWNLVASGRRDNRVAMDPDKAITHDYKSAAWLHVRRRSDALQ